MALSKDPNKHLTPRQQIFVRHYLADLNATQAAIAAGYSPKTARVAGAKTLAQPHIQAELARHIKTKCADADVTADFVLSGLKNLALNTQTPGSEGYNPSAAAKCYEHLGKYLKLFTDKVEHSGNITVVLDSPTGRTPGEN